VQHRGPCVQAESPCKAQIELLLLRATLDDGSIWPALGDGVTEQHQLRTPSRVYNSRSTDFSGSLAMSHEQVMQSQHWHVHSCILYRGQSTRYRDFNSQQSLCPIAIVHHVCASVSSSSVRARLVT
jgi:hypothetical protein